MKDTTVYKMYQKCNNHETVLKEINKNKQPHNQLTLAQVKGMCGSGKNKEIELKEAIERFDRGEPLVPMECEICCQEFESSLIKWDNFEKCLACPDCHTDLTHL